MNYYRGRMIAGALALAFVATLMTANGIVSGPKVKAADAESPSLKPETWKSLVTDDSVKLMLSSQTDLIDKTLKSAGTFRRALKKMEVAGRIVAVLGNVEVLRGSDEAAKKGAALRAAGLDLTKAAEAKNFEDATKAAEAIKSYPDKIALAEDAKPTAWTELLDIDGLMSGVATADTEVKKPIAATKPAEFKKLSKDAEPYALLLAVLGAAARDYEPDKDWQKWCDDMKSESVGLAKAFNSKNEDEAKTARDSLLKSCKACHDAYRVEE